MYKKILITTDGSALSRTVALAGVALAAQLRAEVLALYVAENFQYPIDTDFLPVDYPNETQYRESMRMMGDTHLAPILQAAQAAGLPAQGITAFDDTPAKQIVQCAQENSCDLIYMGSHGRGGWGQLLLGSVTNAVLSNCKIPVLVDRLPSAPE